MYALLWILRHGGATPEPVAWPALVFIVAGAALYVACLWVFASVGRGCSFLSYWSSTRSQPLSDAICSWLGTKSPSCVAGSVQRTRRIEAPCRAGFRSGPTQAVGGFCVVEAKDFDAAVAIESGMPQARTGGAVEAPRSAKYW